MENNLKKEGLCRKIHHTKEKLSTTSFSINELFLTRVSCVFVEHDGTGLAGATGRVRETHVHHVQNMGTKTRGD